MTGGAVLVGAGVGVTVAVGTVLGAAVLANQGMELGDLVVEPVCMHGVTQTDAIASCAADPDPLSGSLPGIGDVVWMEGSYVFDLQHGGWAELHPLYRWGTK